MLAFSILHQKQSPMEICRTSGKWHFSIILAHRRYCPIPLVCHGIPRHISFSESDLLNCLADWLSANSATTNRTGQIFYSYHAMELLTLDKIEKCYFGYP